MQKVKEFTDRVGLRDARGEKYLTIGQLEEFIKMEKAMKYTVGQLKELLRDTPDDFILRLDDFDGMPTVTAAREENDIGAVLLYSDAEKDSQ